MVQVILAGLFFCFASGCTKAPSSEGLSPSKEQVLPQADVVSTFTLVGHSQSGRKKWQVQGQTANLMEETVHLSPVAATSFGEVNVHLTAEQGQFHKPTQDVHLEKDVVVTTSDGARLNTDRLDWKAQREMGRTDDWVTVTRPGMVVVGKGGIGYPKLRRVRLAEQVKVTLQGKEGNVVVTCDGPMEVDYKRNKARFWRNVHVRDSKGLIQSDRMDVTLEPRTNQIRQANCWGHVQIHRKNQVSFSHWAKYHWQVPGRTLLSGHPQLVMRGEEDGQ